MVIPLDIRIPVITLRAITKAKRSISELTAHLTTPGVRSRTIGMVISRALNWVTRVAMTISNLIRLFPVVCEGGNPVRPHRQTPELRFGPTMEHNPPKNLKERSPPNPPQEFHKHK